MQLSGIMTRKKRNTSAREKNRYSSFLKTLDLKRGNWKEFLASALELGHKNHSLRLPLKNMVYLLVFNPL